MASEQIAENANCPTGAEIAQVADDSDLPTIAYMAGVADEKARGRATVAELVEVLRPFAEPHPMGDNYVKFAPRLIHAAREVLSRHQENSNG